MNYCANELTNGRKYEISFSTNLFDTHTESSKYNPKYGVEYEKPGWKKRIVLVTQDELK